MSDAKRHIERLRAAPATPDELAEELLSVFNKARAESAEARGEHEWAIEDEDYEAGLRAVLSSTDLRSWVRQQVDAARAEQREADARKCDEVADAGRKWRATIYDYESDEALAACTQRDVAKGLADAIRSSAPSPAHDPIRAEGEAMAALRELVEAVKPEVNEKGAGGYLLARLSDAEKVLASAPTYGGCWPDFTAPAQYENPDPGWIDPALPPFRTIWEVARIHGYAVGLHGSMKRDVDLIAVPWVDEHTAPGALVTALCKALNARQAGDVEQKPLGRIALTLQIDAYVKPIDLSIVSYGGWEPNSGVGLIAAERTRQVSEEGWTPEHDDGHDHFEMARAAAFYCLLTAAGILPEPNEDAPSDRYGLMLTADQAWPPAWDHAVWKKPKDALRNLIRAGALIAAEIDRLKRLEDATPTLKTEGE